MGSAEVASEGVMHKLFTVSLWLFDTHSRLALAFAPGGQISCIALEFTEISAMREARGSATIYDVDASGLPASVLGWSGTCVTALHGVGYLTMKYRG